MFDQKTAILRLDIADAARKIDDLARGPKEAGRQLEHEILEKLRAAVGREARRVSFVR